LNFDWLLLEIFSKPVVLPIHNDKPAKPCTTVSLIIRTEVTCRNPQQKKDGKTVSSTVYRQMDCF